MYISLLVSLWTLPSALILVFSNIGHAFRKKFPGVSTVLNHTGAILATAVILAVLSGYLHGRFNFRVENVSVEVNGLPAELDGLTIAQVSDLHASSFHRHNRQLRKAVGIIEGLDADIVVNTGDFISFGYIEMKPFTGILKMPAGRIGNFAILGNHDMGTYHPGWGDEEKTENINRLSDMIRETGFDLLVDENRMIEIDSSTIAIIGITTSGSIPDITYGDYHKAAEGTESADLRIFLSHDPGYWVNNRELLSDVEITLSGHTHGMQLGLLTRWFNISPASIIFKAWYGLYGTDNSYLYVNRGLGTLGFPFRIGMPPR
ncbi:MAG: metallophosphoesterase [Bacteroidales bacterium]